MTLPRLLFLYHLEAGRLHLQRLLTSPSNTEANVRGSRVLSGNRLDGCLALFEISFRALPGWARSEIQKACNESKARTIGSFPELSQPQKPWFPIRLPKPYGFFPMEFPFVGRNRDFARPSASPNSMSSRRLRLSSRFLGAWRSFRERTCLWVKINGDHLLGPVLRRWNRKPEGPLL